VSSWSDAAWLGLLLVLSVFIHGWLIQHTEVTARDSIIYIHYALRLEQEPLAQVLRQEDQHPLYPLSILAAWQPVRWALGTSPAAQVWSAQLASNFFGILLVVPMFYLGKELFDRRVGFWAALLFQALPVTAHLLADGLSDSLCLLLGVTAMLLGARALRSGSCWGFTLSGLCVGLAYLARPEGTVVGVAISVVLLGLQAAPAWRRPWGRVLSQVVCLVVGMTVMAAPYMLVIGKFSPKPVANQVLQAQISPTSDPTSLARSASEGARERVARPTSRPLFAAWWHDGFERAPLGWGLLAVCKELLRGYHYLAWLPALAGVIWFRRQLARVPAAWVLLTVYTLFILLLWRLAVVVGYVSERHVQMMVLCGTFPAAAAILALGDWLTARGWRWLGAGLLPALICLCLPATCKPLHTNRAGHRAAGEWLAKNARPFDAVVDPYLWAGFYSGRGVSDGRTSPLPPAPGAAQYFVLEDRAVPSARVPTVALLLPFVPHSTLVYHWTSPGRRDRSATGVCVYRLGRDGSGGTQ
jgi:hypothetical protein